MFSSPHLGQKIRAPFTTTLDPSATRLPSQKVQFQSETCDSAMETTAVPVPSSPRISGEKPELESVPPWFRADVAGLRQLFLSIAESLTHQSRLDVYPLTKHWLCQWKVTWQPFVMTQKKLSKYCDPFWTDKAKIGKKLRTWVQDRFFRSMEDEDWPLSFLRVLAILVQAEEISFMYQSIFSSWSR